MPTALEYLHAPAETFGRFDRRQTTSAAGDLSSLICSDYINSVVSPSIYANWWVLIEDGACAGQVGQVSNSGLTVSTGQLGLATSFTSAIAAGVTFSLYDVQRLPPKRTVGGKPGLLELANQVLRHESVEDTLSIAGVTDRADYPIDLTLYPWLTDDPRVLDVQAPTTTATEIPRALNRAAWGWVSDGETRSLRLFGAPFRTGETFTVKVYRPAYSRLKLNAACRAVLSTTTVGSVVVAVGGSYSATPTVSFSGGGGSGAAATAVLTNGVLTAVTVTNAGTGYTSVPTVSITRDASDTGWADQASQSASLVTLTDEAIPDVRFMRAAMLARGFAELAEMGAPGQTQAEWLGKAAQWTQVAAGLKAARSPKDANAGVVRLRGVRVGGSRRGHPLSWTGRG